MKEQARTNPELIEENALLKQRIRELEQSESEHKRAEEALLESENKFKNFAEQALAGIYLIQDGIFKYVNPKFAQMFGYTVEECLNDMPFKNLVYTDDLTKVEEQIRRRTSGEVEFVHYAFRGIRKNGQLFHVEIYGFTGVHKGRAAAAGTILDITDRKQAEEALRASEERYRTILENIEDGYFEVDIAGNLTFFNDSLCRLNGYPHAEMIGMNYRQYTDKENSQILYQAFNKIFRTGEPSKRVDYEIIGKDGTKRSVESAVSLIKNISGQPIGFRGMIRNITERKQAEQRLIKEVELKNFLLDLYEKAPALTDKELNDYVLDNVVRLTDSTIGFFHLVSDDQKNVILTTWNTEALRNCTASYATHYPIDQAGNWVDCVRLRRSVLYNEFSSSPNQKGLPDGHTPLRRFMSVPVVDGDKVRIIFGVGNKSEEYNEFDAILIQVVANDLQRFMVQRRAEKALNSSEAYFRSLIENASDIIMIADGGGIIRYVSPSVEHVMGLKTSELTGRNIFEYVHPGDETSATDIFARVVQNPGITLSTELRMGHNDGPWHIFEIVAQNLLQNEAVNGIVINSHDITARRQAEEERERLILELRQALSEIKTLSGMLPICSSCKKIRDDKGYWNQIESYIKSHSEAEFSHGICPECAKILYPEYYKKMYPEYDE